MAHYLLAGPVGGGVPAEHMPASRAAAERALELDPALGQAHAMLGWVQFVDERDWEGAGASFRNAFELSPGDALVQSCYADYCVALGRFEDACSASRCAVAISPLDIGIQQSAAEILFFARRYDEAIDAIREVIAMDPARPQSHLLLGEFCVSAGRDDDAVEAYLGWAERVGFPPHAIAAARKVAEGGGLPALARAALPGFTARARETYVYPLMLVMLHARAGDRDEAIRRLEACVDERSVLGLVWLAVNPSFDVLRDDPRFAEVVRRVGIPTASADRSRA
jgi:serine/threonine-protein kinase